MAFLGMPENDQNDHSISDDGNMILNSGMPRNAILRIEISSDINLRSATFARLSSFTSTTTIPHRSSLDLQVSRISS